MTGIHLTGNFVALFGMCLTGLSSIVTVLINSNRLIHRLVEENVKQNESLSSLSRDMIELKVNDRVQDSIIQRLQRHRRDGPTT